MTMDWRCPPLQVRSHRGREGGGKEWNGVGWVEWGSDNAWMDQAWEGSGFSSSGTCQSQPHSWAWSTFTRQRRLAPAVQLAQVEVDSWWMLEHTPEHGNKCSLPLSRPQDAQTPCGLQWMPPWQHYVATQGILQDWAFDFYTMCFLLSLSSNSHPHNPHHLWG